MNTVDRPIQRDRSAVARTAWGRSIEDSTRPNGDILPALAIVWGFSAVRVAGAIWLRQTFGVEATLALITVLAIPFLVLRHLRRRSSLDYSKLN